MIYEEKYFCYILLLALKGKPQIFFFYQNGIASVYVNIIKCLWNIYEIYLSIDFLFVVIKGFSFTKGNGWFQAYS